MPATRKTAKFYQDILSGDNLRNAVAVLAEVIRKFGTKRWSGSKHNDYLKVKALTEFEWNHQIVGFGISSSKENKGRVYVDIYWQGDSTDGDESEWADAMLYGKTIPAVNEWLGDRTYTKHGDLRISRDEFADALKAVARYISPEEIKKRKAAAEEAAKETAFQARVKALCLDRKWNAYKDCGPWSSNCKQPYWNGHRAVELLIEAHREELRAMDDETLSAVLNKVFSNNEKYDSRLERSDPDFPHLKKKVYDIKY